MFTSSRYPRSIGSGGPLIFQRGAANRGECRQAAQAPQKVRLRYSSRSFVGGIDQVVFQKTFESLVILQRHSREKGVHVKLNAGGFAAISTMQLRDAMASSSPAGALWKSVNAAARDQYRVRVGVADDDGRTARNPQFS